MMRADLALLAALGLMGCESMDAKLPAADAAEDAAGKRFAPPAAGQAALYVSYADTRGWNGYQLKLNQRDLGIIGKLMYLRVDVPTGTYVLQCIPTGRVSSAKTISLPANQITYLQVTWNGFSDPACGIEQLSETAGQTEVRARNRILEIPAN
jgi:hypothetical protein